MTTMFQCKNVHNPTNSDDVFPPGALVAFLAQVHQVDIRYFDHTFQPAPNNNYAYSSGGVRAEAGTLHIGHDFEDTTRANIFLEGKSFQPSHHHCHMSYFCSHTNYHPINIIYCAQSQEPNVIMILALAQLQSTFWDVTGKCK